MKTKKLLFGLIEIKAILYNILYTLLCVVILLILTMGLAMLITNFLEPTDHAYYHLICTITSAFIIYFVGIKLMHKNNYI